MIMIQTGELGMATSCMIMLALNLPRSANINMKNKSNINTSRIGFKDFKMSRISLSIEIITHN